jgi:hypothetical protein
MSAHRGHFIRSLAATFAFALAVLAAQTGGAAPSAFPAGQVHILGPPQTVFDWSRQACAPAESPDLPVRALRDYLGRTQLLLSHYENFRMIGSSLEQLHTDCRAVMRSPMNATPARFEDREWLASPFTTDGRRIWALVHEEYQGNRHPGRCPSGSYVRCWYNAVTLARSTDGGRSYVHARAPRQLVAAPPRPYRQGTEPIGVFTPSNIVSGPDGAHYTLVRVRDPSGTRGTCLLRSTRIESPGSWRAWDGHAFTPILSNPYKSPPSLAVACSQVGRGLIAEMTESLTYNDALARYLLVGLAPPGPLSLGAKVTGIYYSTSTDLIHWTPRTLVVGAASTQTYACGGKAPIAYPSVVDPASRSRTYATSGRKPFLYFTQFHYAGCHQTADRDLVRVPLEISP